MTNPCSAQLIYKLNVSLVWCSGFSKDHFSAARREIIERIRSMVFLCMYCNNPNPISLSVIDFEYHISGPFAVAFFICPDCQNKFMVRIEDLGKVMKE
jgi:hypothetical protein